jgi:hypothetical protein
VSVSRPGRTLPPGKTRYPLYRRLGGPQGRPGQVRKISSPPGFDPRTVQPVGSRYTDYATRPILKIIINTNCCIHTVVPPDDGSRYARNMLSLTKYTKNKLCIKLFFFCTQGASEFISLLQWQLNKGEFKSCNSSEEDNISMHTCCKRR